MQSCEQGVHLGVSWKSCPQSMGLVVKENKSYQIGCEIEPATNVVADEA